ncbi:MAG: hypothetical protein BroJett021_28150 [Chloroflexota bacterium]|nr:MAG: hypothetical protein BroJett021_28150 [Chloroflexota bacterium]
MRQPTPDILGDVLSAPKPPTMLAVEAIKVDGGTQMRAGLHEGTVQDYAETFQETRQWGSFPPVVVYHDGENYWLADGFHRLAAWKRSGNAQIGARIPGDVRSGTRRDAILHAAGANSDHGLRRSDEDKRRAVETLLRDDEWGRWSNRELARRCNVSEALVRKIKKDLGLDTAHETQYTHPKTGQQTTMNTANIGANRSISNLQSPSRRYESGLPALNMPMPRTTYDTPFGPQPKMPIEDWELEDIVEQAATEYYGSVTAAQGEEMAQQSRAHAGEYWAKLQRVLAPFDVSVERVEAAVATAVERLVGERRALRPGSPEAKALAREIKAATWADRRGPVVEKGRRGDGETTAAAASVVVDAWAAARDLAPAEPIVLPDERVGQAQRLIALYRQAIASEDEYGALTGCYSDWLAPKRELQKCIDRLQRMVDLLEGRAVEPLAGCD